GVAHEVRNPLAAIKLRVDLLRLGAVTPEVARDLGDVASEVTRLDRLVADLLVATGKRVEQRRTVDLGELAAGRAELLAPWAAERDVGIVASG
ncbi:MAG: sensor histidine kinase, partial [Planctomycetes bacterium]|nr:sensor histidine kinase [Planctomycetota bacterium]